MPLNMPNDLILKELHTLYKYATNTTLHDVNNISSLSLFDRCHLYTS